MLLAPAKGIRPDKRVTKSHHEWGIQLSNRIAAIGSELVSNCRPKGRVDLHTLLRDHWIRNVSTQTQEVVVAIGHKWFWAHSWKFWEVIVDTVALIFSRRYGEYTIVIRIFPCNCKGAEATKKQQRKQLGHLGSFDLCDVWVWSSLFAFRRGWGSA